VERLLYLQLIQGGQYHSISSSKGKDRY